VAVTIQDGGAVDDVLHGRGIFRAHLTRCFALLAVVLIVTPSFARTADKRRMMGKCSVDRCVNVEEEACVAGTL